MILEHMANWRRCFSGPAWEKAFTALEGLGPDAAEGEVKIDGDDLFIRIGEYSTRESDECILETHREFLDIQLMLAGEEGMEWHPAADLKERDAYSPDRDVTLYHPQAGAAPAALRMRPGTFAVFFPADGHRGGLMLDGKPAKVKKAVVKLRLALLGRGPGDS